MKDVIYNENKRPNPIDSFKLYWRDTFNYSKRMGRADFWWGYLTIFSVLLILISLSISFAANARIGGLYVVLAPILIFLTAIYSIWVILARISATVRRLHDIALSGAFYFLSFIPGIGNTAVFILTLLPSKQNGNRYVDGYVETAPQETKEETPKNNDLDQLKDLKQLLDEKVITQEDYDKKKKELLNL